MPCEIKALPFDPWDEIKIHQQKLRQQGKYGAIASFIGTMRDSNQGDSVQSMFLEHYPEMTDRHLARLCQNVAQQWQLIDSLIIHRVGNIEIGDPIVLICVWSVHRADAFDACRFIIEDLKSTVPFWKQETTKAGKRWVTKNTPG